MKLLYIITLSNWGGAQVHLYELIKKAKSENHECVIVLGEPGQLADKLEALNVKVLILNSLFKNIHPFKDLKCILDLCRIIKKENPDLVHAHSSKAGIVGRISAKLCRKPVVFTAHGWAFTEGVSPKKRTIFILIERFVGRFTNKIICVSDYDRNLAIKHKVGNPQNLITIHNGVEDKKVKTSKKVSSSVPIIIMVARFSPQKDFQTLTLALSKLKGEFKAYFVGEGELLPTTESLAQEKRLEGSIQFLGMRQDVDELLVQSDIFVLCSNYEGLPMSIIEAMSKHLPIIATNVGGVKELVEENKNGFLVGRRDVEDLTLRLQYLLDNREKRLSMGSESYKKFKSEFTLSNMLKMTFAVYKEVIKNKN